MFAHRSALLSVLVASSLALGCESTVHTQPTTTVTGTVRSASLTPRSALASDGDFFNDSDGGPTRGLRIRISDKTNSCTNSHFAESTNLDLRIRASEQGGSGIGTYAIVDAMEKTPGPGEAEANFDALDAVCKENVAEAATSGTIEIKTIEVNLTSPELSRITGSVDVTFAEGRLKGDFEAVYCEEDATSDPSAVACTR